ncbi:MAG: hypothetical protein OEV94_01105 [Deltaproteobacteria bacterium]|nr:hypothetical protein [Deltaproteobacteria bacterium]
MQTVSIDLGNRYLILYSGLHAGLVWSASPQWQFSLSSMDISTATQDKTTNTPNFGVHGAIQSFGVRYYSQEGDSPWYSVDVGKGKVKPGRQFAETMAGTMQVVTGSFGYEWDWDSGFFLEIGVHGGVGSFQGDVLYPLRGTNAVVYPPDASVNLNVVNNQTTLNLGWYF